MSLPRVGNERFYSYAVCHVLFLKMNGMYKSANYLILVYIKIFYRVFSNKEMKSFMDEA